MKTAKHSATREAGTGSIPVIDFGPFLHGDAGDREAVARAMRQASADWGFFYLSNHGVPEAMLNQSFDAAKALSLYTSYAGHGRTEVSRRGRA